MELATAVNSHELNELHRNGRNTTVCYNRTDNHVNYCVDLFVFVCFIYMYSLLNNDIIIMFTYLELYSDIFEVITELHKLGVCCIDRHVSIRHMY